MISTRTVFSSYSVATGAAKSCIACTPHDLHQAVCVRVAAHCRAINKRALRPLHRLYFDAKICCEARAILRLERAHSACLLLAPKQATSHR
jgi:hypothetical protein